MPKPSLSWVRRRTNVEDLLDDGVENGSDLSRYHGQAEKPPGPAEEAALVRREEMLAVVRSEQAGVSAQFRRKAISPFGAVLGVVIALAGVMLIVHPVDMHVEHRRTRYLPTIWEHVTPLRSRLYGAAGAVFGAILVGYCLRRPS